MRRLRTRVTVAATVVAFAIMAVAAVAMVAVQRRQLAAAVDAALTESAVELSKELDVSFERGGRGDRGRSDHNDGVPDLAVRVLTSNRPIQLLDTDGEVLASSYALAGVGPLVDIDDVLPELGRTGALVRTVGGHERPYRVLVTALDSGQLVLVGYSLADVDHALEVQRLVLVVAVPLLSGLLGVLIWVVLGRALRPVEEMRGEVATISAAALDRRVAVPDRSVELARLATTMNDMLDRLAAAARRQNRFVSDAAHELRSPLAGIRGHLEVNLHHPDAPDRLEGDRLVLEETVRMQRLVDDLLLLARADHGSLELPVFEVDLDDLVLDEAAQLRRTTTHHIGTARIGPARVRGDASQLRRVIRNLADNAARHARSTVAFELAEDRDGVVLAVSDDGPGVEAAAAEAIFDRFTRLDESRHRDAGGSGLGLAICREIVERHHGTIVLDVGHRDGARFVVRLPLADAPNRPGPDHGDVTAG